MPTNRSLGAWILAELEQTSAGMSLSDLVCARHALPRRELTRDGLYGWDMPWTSQQWKAVADAVALLVRDGLAVRTTEGRYGQPWARLARHPQTEIERTLPSMADVRRMLGEAGADESGLS